MRTHDASRRKVERINRLLAIPDCRPHHLQRLCDHETGQRALDGDGIVLGDADADDAAAEAEQVERGGVGGVVGGEDEHGVGAQAVGRVLDGGHDVRGLVDGDEVLGAALEDNVLLGRVVDADDAVPDGAGGELHGEMA